MANNYTSQQAFLASSALLDHDLAEWEDDIGDLMEFFPSEAIQNYWRVALLSLHRKPGLISPFKREEGPFQSSVKSAADEFLATSVELIKAEIDVVFDAALMKIATDIQRAEADLERSIAAQKNIKRSGSFVQVLEKPGAKSKAGELEASVHHEELEFIPSRAITQFWQDGLKAFMELSAFDDVVEGDLLTEDDITHEKLAQEFATRFRNFIATLGHRQKHGLEDNRRIAVGERFSLSFQLQLLETVQIIPDQNGEFFAVLYDELSMYLANGGQLSGTWGRLVQSGRDILLESSALKPRAHSNWKKATIVE